MLYLELQSDEEAADHRENDDEEKRTAEYLEKRGLKIDEYGDIVQDVTSKVVALICSCGHYTCGAISRFGHPEPVFKEFIEPLWPQSTRDKRALAMKDSN